MKNNIFIIAIAILFSSALDSQTMADVLRYSFVNPTGSARFLGAGGSMGALGADYSSISVNPAGLGAYWTSEFVISPSILSSKTDSRLKGITNEGRNVASLKIDNFGMVFNNTPKKGGLKSFNTAIGMNKIADFNDEFTFSGYTQGTIAERFAERANGKDVDNLDAFEADLAYASGVIYAPDENNTYYTDFLPSDFVQKSQDVDQSGGINELLFGFGGNLGNKILIGVTVGVPFLNYESTKTYTETDESDEIPAFNKLEFKEYLNTSGIGYNIKAGAIFKLTKELQIGGAIHSPTKYILTDNYFNSLSYSFFENTNQELSQSSPDGSFKYRLETPWKAIASVGFKKKVGKIAGFVNGDLEWIDYRNGSLNLVKYSSNQLDAILQEDINEQVESQLLSVINLKIGSEIAYNKFRFRGGYNMLGSPYAADKNVFFPAYSMGIGWREDKYYLDFGFRTSKVKEGYIPYSVLDDDRLQLVENNIKNTKVAVTLGFQF